jgi:hypothetical protein
MRTLITLAAAALLAGGCASGGAPGASTPPRGSRYLVTQEELASNADRSVYEVLQQLHPAFLRTRDIITQSHPDAQPVDVYVDGGRTEGIEALKSIRASTVKEVRFYEPADANLRFGNGHNGGLIAVTLK